MKLRIMLVDDRKAFRDQIRRLLESRPGWEVVAETGNGAEAVPLAGQFQPDVVIVDYSLPELDGISAIPLIRSAAPLAEIIILTIHDVLFTARRAVEAGARGYVVKSEARRDLIPAVEAAQQHKVFIGLRDSEEVLPDDRKSL